MASFMLEATPGQYLEFRVLPLRALDLTAGGRELLLREVLALQKARQIGRADDQPAIEKLHLALLLQGHSTARMRQLSVVRTEHREGWPPAFSCCEPAAAGSDRGDAPRLCRAAILGFHSGGGLHLHRPPLSPAVIRWELDDRTGLGYCFAHYRAVGSGCHPSRRLGGGCTAAMEAVLADAFGQPRVHPPTRLG